MHPTTSLEAKAKRNFILPQEIHVQLTHPYYRDCVRDNTSCYFHFNVNSKAINCNDVKIKTLLLAIYDYFLFILFGLCKLMNSSAYKTIVLCIYFKRHFITAFLRACCCIVLSTGVTHPTFWRPVTLRIAVGSDLFKKSFLHNAHYTVYAFILLCPLVRVVVISYSLNGSP